MTDDTALTTDVLGLGPPLFDPSAFGALRDLVGGDRETLIDIIDAFLEEAPRRLVELRQGFERDDAELAGRAAHTLKSNALTFGALGLAADSRDIEAAVRRGGLADAGDLVGRVESAWKLVRAAQISLRDATSG